MNLCVLCLDYGMQYVLDFLAEQCPTLKQSIVSFMSVSLINSKNGAMIAYLVNY